MASEFIFGADNTVNQGGKKNSINSTTSTTSSSLKQKAKNLFSGAFSKLKDMVFEKSRKSFSKYKYNPELTEESIYAYNPSDLKMLVLFEKVNEIVTFII
jgi:hypothetical protein